MYLTLTRMKMWGACEMAYLQGKVIHRRGRMNADWLRSDGH